MSSQVEWARGAGESLLGDMESTTLGARTGVSWSDYSIFAAYNQMISGSSSAIGIGGDPYYTSLEYRSFADIGRSNGFAIEGGLRFEPADCPLNFEFAAGRFKGSGQNEFDVREIDLSIGYNLSNGIDLRMFFSSLSGRGHKSNDHRLMFSMNVPF